MASTHKHIRSSTANKRPTTAIADGQVALNTNAASPGLFFKDSTGASIIKIGPVHVGSTAPNATPGAGGSAGNSTGEVWLDNSLSPVGVKIWDGSAWVNATPAGSTTVQGLLELATDAETQAGSDTARAVTSAGLQSKVSDSTSTTSSTTIASSTAVKAAYDLAAAALPLSGGIITGNLEIGTTGSLSFEGSTADAFETTIAVTNPTADRTITLPDTTGTVVTTGDTGTVTSTMIADGTIVNGDINASAAIAHSKLANITAGQVLLGNASNVPTATALSGDVTVNSSGVTAISSDVIVNADVNASAAIAGTKISPDFGSQTITTTGVVSAALGAAATPSITFTGDLNTGIYSPGADQVAVATNGTGRLFVNSSGLVGIGASSPASKTEISLTGISSGKTDSANWGANGIVQLVNSDGATNGSEILLIGCQAGGLGQIASGLGFGRGSSGWGTYLNFYTHSDSTTNIDELIERVRIDSSGRVGIGTTSPNHLLQINSSTVDGRLHITNSVTGSTNSDGFQLQVNNSDVFFHNQENGQLIFQSNSTERFRVDTSGRLLVGTSSGDTGGVIVRKYEYQATNYMRPLGYYGVDLGMVDNTNTRVWAAITSQYNQGSAVSAGLFLSASHADTGGSACGYTTKHNKSDHSLAFSYVTTGASVGSPAVETERMRINSAGNLSVGTSTSTGTFITAPTIGLWNGGSNNSIQWFGSSPTPSMRFTAWWDVGNNLYITDSDYSHGVALAQNSNAWGSFSDARLKQDIACLSDAINLVKAINPCRFKWKSGLQDDVGFIAQELKPVLPEAVDGEESDFREGEDGRIYGPMTVKYEKLIPVLTAALQEAITKIETLEAKVAALEAA